MNRIITAILICLACCLSNAPAQQCKPPQKAVRAASIKPNQTSTPIASIGVRFNTAKDGTKSLGFDKATLRNIANADPYVACALYKLQQLPGKSLKQGDEITFLGSEITFDWVNALIDSEQTFEDFYAKHRLDIDTNEKQISVVYRYEITEFADKTGVFIRFYKKS
jgi:hypothetical protein